MKNLLFTCLAFLMMFLATNCGSGKIPLDSDNDGIADTKDMCPNTPKGKNVNKSGCSGLQMEDSDGDGVANNEDQCPSTPPLEKGFSVDRYGCLRGTLTSEDPVTAIKPSTNQIILSGFENYSEEERLKIKRTLMNEYEIDENDIETCSCDKDIQLWTLPDSFDLNNPVATAKSEGGEDLEGNRNFFITFPDEVFVSPLVPEEKGSYKLEDNKDLPVIAILDSGLDTEQLSFNGLQLLDTEKINQTNCTNDSTGVNSKFGWNFVDGNADMRRDRIAHGTNVTKTFIKSLGSTALKEFQLLPLKLFGQTRGSYWHIVCAFSYLKKIESLGYDIALINTSFGGELKNMNIDDLSILKNLIDDLEASLVVASAGNKFSNNDVIPHFPSNYPSDNIMVAAGHDGRIPLPPTIYHDGPHYGSNYGLKTVDIAAPWQFTIVEPGQSRRGRVLGINLKGTSYSTPITTANLLEHYLQTKKSKKGSYLKTDFLTTSRAVRSSTTLERYVKDGKYLHK